VHDLFDILGLPTDARPSDIRRAYARRPRRPHPDFCDAGAAGPSPALDPSALPPADVAVDFLNVSALLERLQSAFFADPS
jgi:hypothetical protein